MIKILPLWNRLRYKKEERKRTKLRDQMRDRVLEQVKRKAFELQRRFFALARPSHQQSVTIEVTWNNRDLEKVIKFRQSIGTEYEDWSGGKRMETLDLAERLHYLVDKFLKYEVEEFVRVRCLLYNVSIYRDPADDSHAHHLDGTVVFWPFDESSTGRS